eukprot:7385628-Prymnesium_polylepis.6
MYCTDLRLPGVPNPVKTNLLPCRKTARSLESGVRSEVPETESVVVTAHYVHAHLTGVRTYYVTTSAIHRAVAASHSGSGHGTV